MLFLSEGQWVKVIQNRETSHIGFVSWVFKDGGYRVTVSFILESGRLYDVTYNLENMPPNIEIELFEDPIIDEFWYNAQIDFALMIKDKERFLSATKGLKNLSVRMKRNK